MVLEQNYMQRTKALTTEPTHASHNCPNNERHASN